MSLIKSNKASPFLQAILPWVPFHLNIHYTALKINVTYEKYHRPVSAIPSLISFANNPSRFAWIGLYSFILSAGFDHIANESLTNNKKFTQLTAFILTLVINIFSPNLNSRFVHSANALIFGINIYTIISQRNDSSEQ